MKQPPAYYQLAIIGHDVVVADNDCEYDLTDYRLEFQIPGINLHIYFNPDDELDYQLWVSVCGTLVKYIGDETAAKKMVSAICEQWHQREEALKQQEAWA